MSGQARDERALLSDAVRLAHENAERGEQPFAALVVADGRVVGTGFSTILSERDPRRTPRWPPCATRAVRSARSTSPAPRWRAVASRARCATRLPCSRASRGSSTPRRRRRHLDDRSVRRGAVLHAEALEDLQARVGEHGPRERGLADPGLAREQDDRSVASGGGRRERCERVSFRLAADQQVVHPPSLSEPPPSSSGGIAVFNASATSLGAPRRGSPRP
jgi:hypothetical protein